MNAFSNQKYQISKKNWANEHLLWDNEKWAKTNSIAREYVQRSFGIRNSKKICNKYRFNGGVLMVWAYTKCNGRNLIKIDGTLNT